MAAIVLGGGVLALLLVPGIEEAKQNDREAERREAAERRAELVSRLRAEIRPRVRRAPALAAPADGSPESQRRRQALVDRLEGAVLADARARVASGDLEVPAREATCERFPRSADRPPPHEEPSARTGRYECLATTSRFSHGPGERGAIGYPFRARVDFVAGTYAFCKISGRAGEGGMRGRPLVEVPAICGGS